MITFLEGRGELVDFDRNKKKNFRWLTPQIQSSIDLNFKNGIYV